MALTDNGTADAAVPLEAGGLPSSVKVGGTPRLTPNEIRVLKATTGRTLQDVFSDEADVMQAMVWLKLRRAGYNVSWAQAGDIEADMVGEPVDPMNVGTLPTLPLSADSGE